MSTLRLSRPSFSVPKYIFHSFYYRVSRTQTMTKEKNVRCGAASLSVNENHNRPLINKSVYFNFPLCPGNYKQHKQCLKSVIMKSRACLVGFDTRRSTQSRVIDL